MDLWIAREVLTRVQAEAADAMPNETGGLLLGYWAVDHSPVVMDWVGPGPRAVHEPTRFVPDYRYHEQELARRYEESRRRLQYLGDWHTHPNATAYLSPRDRSAIKKIAKSRSARCKNPVMLILAPGPRWTPSAWIAALTRRTLRSQLHISPLDVQVFE